MQRELTRKEQLVIQIFEKLKEGYGAIAEKNILSGNSGWAEIIDSMTEEEIKLENLKQGIVSNG